jgi:hypothetical protein
MTERLTTAPAPTLLKAIASGNVIELCEASLAEFQSTTPSLVYMNAP